MAAMSPSAELLCSLRLHGLLLPSSTAAAAAAAAEYVYHCSTRFNCMTHPPCMAGVTIVATIHSPTAYAYSLFDSLLMLVSVLRCAALCNSVPFCAILCYDHSL